MPNNYTDNYQVTYNGKTYNVPKNTLDKQGWDNYAQSHPGATLRMRDKNNADYDVPFADISRMQQKGGLRPYNFRVTHKQRSTQRRTAQPSNNLSQRITQRSAQRPASQSAPMVAQPAAAPAAPSTPTTNYTGPIAKQEPFKGLDVEPAVEYNQKTGSFTKSNKHKYTSEVKPTAKKQSTTPLQDAIADKERLSKMMEARMRELEQQQQDMPWWQQLGSAGKTGMGADMNYEAISNGGLLNDDEYIKLQAAYNEADRRIRNLQALQNKDGFWASLGRNLKRRDLWDNGITDFTTGMGKLRAKTDPKNDKSESTQELLKQEAAADAAEQQADQELGDAARWGRMAAESASYTPYFIQFGGIMNVASKAGAKAATNIAERLGAKGLMRTVTKGTGKVLGDVGGSLGLTVGPQALRTSSDAIDRYVGHVDVDDDGNFTYTGGKGAGRSVYEGIANSTIENFTELVFDGMPGVADIARGGLAKLGLKGASRWIDKATGSQLYKASQKMLRRAGVGNLTGEIAEEEINIPLNALFVGDNSFSDLLDKDQQKDIVGGVALSTALMHGVSLAAQGAGRGLSAAAYARYMHNLNKADSKAAELIGDEWEGMKESLDQSTNDEWAKALSRITDRSDLTDEQKIAAVDYANRLVQQRGYNLGQNAASEKGLQNPVEQSASEAYLNGMEENDPSNLSKIVINLNNSRKDVAEKLGINEDEVDDELNDPVNYMNTHPNADKQAIVNYANGKAAYDGMIQQQKYRIDDAVSQNENLIDSHTNKDTGMITRASLKAKDDSGNDKQVYIIGGTVNMMEDGSGIDKDKSSGSVIVIDENGEQSMISPIEILSLDAPIDPAEEKRVTSDAIREQMASEFETLINSYINQPATEQATKTYNPGDELTINDESGNPIGAEIISQADENGRYLVRSESPINGNVVNSFTADEINNLTGVQQSSETPVEEQPANMAPEAPQVNESESVPESEEAAAPEMGTNAETAQQIAEAQPATALAPETQEQEQPSALSRIPIDEKGEPLYEQADSETAWDAIMEQTEGDENDAREVINSMIADKENELKKLEKSKPKAGTTISQKIAAQKEHKAVVQQARDALKKWQDIAAIPDRRASMAREEAQKAAKAEAEARRIAAETEKAKQEEEARKQREALNGVPDYVQDTPTDARARGYRRVNGEKIDRQEPISAPMGKEIEVKFSDNEKPKGLVAVIDAAQLQPSHLNGNRNPLHFIDEAQPKERNDEASRLAAQKIASDIRPEEITSSTTAYTGAPTVNTRGEVIQGNNRSIALRDMWAEYPEQAAKYKQYLMDHAQDYGLNADDIANMDNPVLVNMIDVPDDQAIQLGQYVAQDTESGGVERIKPQNAVRKIGKDMNIFAGLLLNSNNDETTFSELLDANGLDALKWLNKKGIITDTQYKSAFDSKGNINAEAKNDLKGIMYQGIFQNGNTHLEEMFGTLPAKAQRAILATAYRDYDSPQNERLVPEIQQSIMAYYALQQYESFAQAKNYKEAMMAAQDWRRQAAFDDVTGESYLPSERYSNFALLLATMYKGQTQTFIQNTLKKIFDLVQGTQETTLFDEPDNTPRSLVEAINETLSSLSDELLLNENFIYNGQLRNHVLAGSGATSQPRGQGSVGSTTSGGRTESGTGTNGDNRRTENDSVSSRDRKYGRENQSRTEEGKNAKERLTKEEAAGIIADMEKRAETAPEIELNIENWDALFGADGRVNTPLGEVKMGENQFAKLMRQGRNGKLGMIKPTLENPDIIIEDKSQAKKGDNTERPSSYIFVKTFVKADGSRYYYFASITVSKEGREVVVSSQEKSRNRILRLMLEGSVIWRTPKDATTSSAEKQGLDYAHPNEAEDATKGSGITPQSTSSIRKDSEKSHLTNKLGEKIAEAEEETNTAPTEAQKEAGNYKKGHVRIDGYDVTIEQPKGSIRRGKDKNGKAWESKMHYTYGYIRGTEGVDGDHIDVFLSDDPSTGNVFVVDQVDPETGAFDEHKVMYGFDNEEEAREAYLSNYEKGWKGLGNITEVSKDEFKKWINSSKRKTKPFAEYKSVKPTENETKGYTIEERFHKKRGMNIYAVKFEEQMPRDKFVSLKSQVKQFGGYYSSYGKGGFIFQNKDDAQQFAEAVMDPSGEMLEDAKPLSLSDAKEIGPKQIDVIGLMQEIKDKGTAKLSDHVINEEQKTTEKENDTNAYGSQNKLVSRARYEELKKRMKEKLNQLNFGMDPELLEIGLEMTAYHLEAGSRKFADYAKAMINDLGDAIRPYLKSFYNYARDYPEVIDAGLAQDMTPSTEVEKFDVANFDKNSISAVDAAEVVVKEQTIKREAKKAKDELIETRNNNRRKQDEQSTANTESIVSQTETIASDAESRIEKAETEEEVNNAIKDVDKHLQTIDDQLSALDYTDNLHSGMRVVLKDGKNVMLSIVMHSGEQISATQMSAPRIERLYGSYRGELIEFTPDNIDVDATIKLNEPQNEQTTKDNNKKEKKSYNGYKIGDKVTYTPQNKKGKSEEATIYDFESYGSHKPVLDTGLAPVLYEVVEWNEIKHIDLKENTKKQENNPEKIVSSQQQNKAKIADLFANSEQGEEVNNDYTESTGSTETTSGSNRTVGDVPAGGNRVLGTTGSGENNTGDAKTDTAGQSQLDNGERSTLSEQRSGRGDETVTDGSSKGQPELPDGGRSLRTGSTQTGRKAESGENTGYTQTDTGKESNTEDRKRNRTEADVRTRSDSGRGKVPEQPSPKSSSPRTKENRRDVRPLFKRNFVYTNTDVDKMTPSERIKANVSAIEVLRDCLTENRQATPEEQEILSTYRGWGGIEGINYFYTTGQMRNYIGRNSEQFHKLADLIDELDPKGKKNLLGAIRNASLTSYYTPLSVASAMNNFLVESGFNGGSLLDPSMGNGIFEGTLKKSVQQRTVINGVELDWLTGQIAHLLYPDANIQINGFENTSFAPNSQDVVISNIPFGSFGVSDTRYERSGIPAQKSSVKKIHNYFAVRMVESTRPGGLTVIMTSNAIMDTQGNQIIRDYMADNSEILGIIRLPDNTFKGAGTSVVTDVIFLRKFKDNTDRENVLSNPDYKINILDPFRQTGKMNLKSEKDGQNYDVSFNSYFTHNPNMMIGTPSAGGQYRNDGFTLKSSLNQDEIGQEMGKIISEKIIGQRKGKLFDTVIPEREINEAVKQDYVGDGDYIGNGNIVEQNGKLGILRQESNQYGEKKSTFVENTEFGKNAERIKAMFPLRKAMKKRIADEINDEPEEIIRKDMEELQSAYDQFVQKYGRLNDRKNNFLTEDIDGYSLRALEIWETDEKNKPFFSRLSDLFTKMTIKPKIKVENIKNPQEAIAISLATYGEIRPSFMNDTLGEDWKRQCGDTIFEIPNTNGLNFVTRDEYLSGDVKTKLQEAEEAAKNDKKFERNVDALKEVQPSNLSFNEINVQMGARWVPVEIYNQFLQDVLGVYSYSKNTGVTYARDIDTYTVLIDKSELGGAAERWGTDRKSPAEIFEAALKDQTLSVYDNVKNADGTIKRVFNLAASEEANEKVRDLREEFQNWLPRDIKRVEELTKIYNDTFHRNVLRKFDGSHLNVPGLMGKEPRPHQKDATWMLICNRGGIVDHIVGAGKTLVMQMAIMEMRRMGIAKKPMIVALKATTAQIAKEFRESFPAARVLAPTEKDFSLKNRKKFLSNIAQNDWDCVVLSHEQYVQLPHTQEIETLVINEQLEQLNNTIEYLYGTGDRSKLTKRQIKGLEQRRNNLQSRLKSMTERRVDREFTFENLGVDYLFVDECQAFKSLPYTTSYNNVAGLADANGSQKAIALLNGVRYLQQKHQGDYGTTFLSGTTITNSLVEIYNLLQYLRPSELNRLGMNTFDAWASTFAERSSELEYGVTNQLKEKNRFRKFSNVSELSQMYAEMADVRNDLNLKLPKPKAKVHIVAVPASEALQEINDQVVEMVKTQNGSYFGIPPREKQPWGLLASNISTKAAISVKLIDPTLEEDKGKIYYVCENVKKVYDKFNDQKGCQLIFCDTGVPGANKAYDAYSDIIDRLVNQYGIPRKEIADIHEADTDEKRKALFQKVREGKVRILIGGTKNMGTGVNVQDRIVAMHHVDVPWTPADREQREGRGVRQGNIIARDYNDNKVDIYFYAAEGSLDMYKYQLQDIKGKMFAQFKTGTVGEREFDEGSEDEDGSLDAAAVVAILSGNPVILEKSKQDKLVERLRRSKRNYETDWQRRKKIYDDLQISKKNYDRLVKENKRDVDYLTEKGFVPNEKGVYPSNVSVSYVSRYNTEGTKEFDKPKEAGAYIHSLLKSKKKVVLSGYGIKAEIALDENDINGLFTTPQYLVSTGLKSNIKYSVPLSDDDTNAGLAFRSLLQKAIKNQEIYTNKYTEVQNKLEGADPGPNEFPKQKELDEAIEKKKEIDDAYKALSNENERFRSEENLREGNGSITDDELSYENDPIAKVIGKSTRSAKQRKAFAERERRNMITTLQVLSEKLKLNNVEIVTDASTLSGRKARAKGFYSRDTGKITIVIPNHTSVQDAVQTLLHEAVAHYGLRKLFGENFDNFLDNVFNNAEPDVRERIVNLASKRGWDFRTATEEYLASLAENTNFENIDPSWWMRIKQFFLDMLNKLGLKGFNQVPLSDNELRYILWRSYQNLSHPEYYNTIFGEAEDIAKQNELKVGNYAPTEIQAQTVAEESIVDTNRRFNEELRQQIDGNLPKGHVYELGRPGRVLRSTGIPDLPIELAASRLGKKASKDYESNHPFELESVMDLPKAIQHPIAVFESKTKAGSKVIMVELKDRNGNNFVVAMNTNVPKNRFSKASIQINDIRSIYPKDNVKDIVNWINRGDLLRYADKKKIEDWITQQRSNSAEVEIQNLDVAAKVVENFKNPNIEEENNNLLFRDRDETSPLSGSTIDAWDKLANSFKFQLRETSVDYLTAVEKFQQLIEKSSGKKIQDYENAYDYMTFLSSKNRQEMDMFDSFIVKPINKAISNLVGKKHTFGKWTWEKGPLRELVMYVEAKHGTDRNRQMAVENSINDFKAPNLEFFENAGIGFDMNVYKQELEEAGKTAYDAAYEKAREKMNEETPEAEENAKKKAELAELRAKEVFANKKMQQLNEQYREKQYNDWMQAKETINSTDGLSWKDKQDMLDEEAHKLNADLLRDYSGISSVFGDKEKYPSGWLESARNYVTEYESNHPEENIKQLWNTIGNATRYALEKQYETGLVSADYVRRQRQRFDNYIPLRGFEDEIAGDVYKYIGSEFYPGSNPVKTAHGRTSEAGNPFGSILNTAYSSISVGNKNMAKMAFYSLVVNHDTGGLAVANRAWMIKYDALKNDPELEDLLVTPQSDGNEETPEWVEAVPKMFDGITASEMKDILSRFEEAMRKGQREGIAKPIGKKSKIAYRTLYKERNEHDIPLFISGDKYVITITGNPRVAQSMNGLLNPDVDENGLTQMAKKIQQFMAGAFTAKNAAFSIANLAKDTIYSNNQTFIRENPIYWLKFTINQKAGFGAYPKMMEMLFKYQRGTLDVSKKIERDFYSFMKNGGATGYTFVNSQEEYARELSKKLKEISKKTPGWLNPKKIIQSLFDLTEFAGQSAELVNRFAAYQTSRQMGRSVNRAIRDAKEITVNFNRKGAGRKTVDKNKPWYSPINILSALSQYGRTSILFWNANMQAKYRFYLNMKEHPIKTSATLIGNSMAFAAVLLPLINNLLLPALYSAFGLGGDDDDDDYFNALTDWERTHNMCVRLPNGNWLKIPLSPEMSPWFTMGDAIGGQISGQRDLSSSDFIKSSMDAISPLSINWSYGTDAKILLNVLPTVSQPIMQNMMNVNFMGNPIKKTPFNNGNSFTPEFLMTYRSASPSLVELSRLSNLAGGGTEKKTSGNISDWNPSMLQNLITGYTGGFGQTFLSAADWIVNTSKGESQAITFSRMPLASRFFISGNKDVKISRINSRYYDVRDFLDEFEFDKRSYEKSIQESGRKHDMIDLAQNITEYQQLMRGSRAVQYVQLKEYDNAIQQYERYLKLFPDDEVSMNQYNTLKAQAVKVYDEIKQNNNGK